MDRDRGRSRERYRKSRRTSRHRHDSDSDDSSRESKNNRNERTEHLKDKIRLAKLADKAERYEDVFSIMQEVTKEKDTLSSLERHLLWVGLRESVGPYRSAWRVVCKYEDDLDRNDKDMARKVSTYKKKLASKVINYCRDSLDLLDDVLLPGIKRNSKRSDRDTEGKVFYLKMKGDIFRYLCEVDSGDQRRHAREAEDAYESAYKEAKEELRSAHPLRLGLALNYSVFHFEIMDDRKSAVSLAKRSVESADHTLKKLDDSEYKEAKNIMASLNENIELWEISDRRKSRSKRR